MSDRSITLYLVQSGIDDHRLVDDHGHEIIRVLGRLSHTTLENLHLFASVTTGAFVKIVGETVTITSVGGVACFRVTEDVDDPIIRRLAKMIRGELD